MTDETLYNHEQSFPRRTFLKVGAAAGLGGLAFKCGGVSKEKAVRVAGFVIELAKESLPLLTLLGQADIATLVKDKAIPAMEKLKDALANADIPTSQSTLETVRNVLSGIEKALLNLPESPRVITVMGILASVNVLLLTVEAFVESEAPTTVSAAKAGALKPSTNAEAIRKVLEASRPQ